MKRLAWLQTVVGQVHADIVQRELPALRQAEGKTQAVGLDAQQLRLRDSYTVCAHHQIVESADLGIAQCDAVEQQFDEPRLDRIFTLKIVGPVIAVACEVGHRCAFFSGLAGGGLPGAGVFRQLVCHQSQMLDPGKQGHCGNDVCARKRIDHLLGLKVRQFLFGPGLHRRRESGPVIRGQPGKGRALVGRQSQSLQQRMVRARRGCSLGRDFLGRSSWGLREGLAAP